MVGEIRELTRSGVREVVISGVHLGGYGSDNGASLGNLVGAILEQTDIERLRLGSLEPWGLEEEFFGYFSDPRLMPHLHLPLQSGNDRTLRRMGRRCRKNSYADLLQRLRNINPDFNITTDIIVGFPGESDEFWRESLAFIKECEFSHLHIFPYSQRPGTAAAGMPEQVPHEIKKARTRELHQLGLTLKSRYLQRLLNRDFPVLLEKTIANTRGYRPDIQCLYAPLL